MTRDDAGARRDLRGGQRAGGAVRASRASAASVSRREVARQRPRGAPAARAQPVDLGLREFAVAQRVHAMREQAERLAQPLGRERLDEVVDDAEVHALAHDVARRARR